MELNKEESTVGESGGELSEKTAMHFLPEDGILKIRFCKSVAGISVKSDGKHLTVEVPESVALSVNTKSVAVKANAPERNGISSSAHSGRTGFETVNAGGVNSKKEGIPRVPGNRP